MPQRLYTPYKNRNGLKMRCKKCECSKKDLRQADWPGWKGATNRPQERHGKGVRQRRANTPCAGRVCTCVISVACARNAIDPTHECVRDLWAPVWEFYWNAKHCLLGGPSGAVFYRYPVFINELFLLRNARSLNPRFMNATPWERAILNRTQLLRNRWETSK